ncbi:hypothetical protein EMPS_01615 [Entomortierella parvispora]|uniref:Uncharacterized protein n=1 Tax=Entomortierella parvispora TaxID=205924 RepID=A0A9P3H376_9FUNG|nr:hypothetical protein EMPS_01615 [Entomortierella parvispora]
MASLELNTKSESGVRLPGYSQADPITEPQPARFARIIHPHIRLLEIGIAAVALVNVCVCGVAVALFNKQSLISVPVVLDNPFFVIGQLILSAIVVVCCIVALTSRVRGSPPLRLLGSILVIGINIYLIVHDFQFLYKKKTYNEPVEPLYCSAFADGARFSGQAGFAAMNLCTLETVIQIIGLVWSLGLLVECVVMFEHHRRRSAAPQTQLDETIASDLRVGFFGENALPTSRLEQYYGKNYPAVMNGSVKLEVPATAPQLQQQQQPRALSLNDYIRHGAAPSGTTTTLMS